ncbi:ribonuclease T2 [Bombina bombina]|uniref:ribonuclease T2 n=1 Tax=Bombina bombina TaxID=8345 RepID=UPI00235A65C5|nr:ribonuclease T2 [Bombina bombina]XP_053553975.1 ribonuclease T2 [Bombina bombina]
MSQPFAVYFALLLSLGFCQENLRSCKWDCLIFAQMWPGSFCPYSGNSFKCQIPQFVNSWTIHGLWPNGVTHCCDCSVLFQSHLENIEGDMSIYWPSFTNDTNFFFWNNEWTKHGTCAICDERLSSPERYFGASLKLYQSLNIQRALMTANIVPTCNQTYKYLDILHVLQAEMGNNLKVQCSTDSKGRQLLNQVMFSLYPNLTSGSCSHLGLPYNSCDSQKILFPPINYDPPHDPCP